MMERVLERARAEPVADGAEERGVSGSKYWIKQAAQTSWGVRAKGLIVCNCYYL
jgi:hypothetical protein